MIPKIVHYCWFGLKEKNEIAKKCITTRKNKLKDYEIIERNENNCDIENAPKFVKEAYEQQKWAFVSDYFRLVALKRFGGIYLDTDVEVISDFGNLLNLDLFLCFESEGYICTAVIGSEKENIIISRFLQTYEEREFDTTPNSKLLYNFIFDRDVYDIKQTIKVDENFYIFSSDYFSPKNFYTHKLEITNNTICIHHFDGTWKSKKQLFKDKMFYFCSKILGVKTANKIKKRIKRRN